MSFWRSSAKASEALVLGSSISKSQAVTKFNMDGTTTANQHCLDTLGDRLAGIAGGRYSNFVPATVRLRGLSHALERSRPGQDADGRSS
jgi:hypothetical protein